MAWLFPAPIAGFFLHYESSCSKIILVQARGRSVYKSTAVSWFFFKVGVKMCGMSWPLGGKAEWQIRCSSAFSVMLLFEWHLWEIWGKLSALWRHADFCLQGCTSVIPLTSSSHYATCGASTNCLLCWRRGSESNSFAFTMKLYLVSWGNVSECPF